MSTQSDLIDFFQLNATFDYATRITREVTQGSDRAQLKRQIVTVKEWRREADPIGHGGSGIIWLEHAEDGKESRVVKEIRKTMQTTPLHPDYNRELQALGRLSKRQDLFVHFYGWFENDKSIFLAMEYFELGDLENFITPKLSEKDVKVIGRQLLEGLQVLHGYHLAHRDLKPANILVARSAPDWWIKLGDFGIVKRIFTEHNSKLSLNGTFDYMAPELQLENYQNLLHTLAIDIWSLGCVLFRLLTQELPFPELKHLRLYCNSKRPFPTDVLIKNNVSEDGAFFVSEMMKPNPADRITISMALLHSWVSTQDPGYLDSVTQNIEDEHDGKSTKEGFAAESSNTSYIANRIMPNQNQELLPSTNHLTNVQNEEVVKWRKSTSDAEERILGLSDKNASTFESRYNLANSYLELGLYKKAMQLFQQTFEAHRQLLGDEHSDTLRSRNNLAKSFTKLGRDQEALQIYQQTLEVLKRVLGNEHPDTLKSMNGLTVSYSTLGQERKAIDLCKQTLELRKRVLGDEHPDTLWSMHRLAVSYSKLGQDQEAMRLCKQTLELRKRILGDEHPNTLWSMHGLAASYSKLGQDQEAMHLYKQTLELQKHVLGDEHPDTLWSMHGLAVSYSNLGQDQEAMRLCKQTLELRKRVLGDEHPNTLWSMHGLAVCYSNLGQEQEAMRLCKQTLELRKRVLGDEHPYTLLTMKLLARLRNQRRGISRYMPFLRR